MKNIKKYEAAEVEIVVIEAGDVITTSSPFDFSSNDGDGDNKW